MRREISEADTVPSGWIRRFAAAAGVCIVLATGARGQSTWFVDASATPPGLGTPLQPYQSIQYAIAQPGTITGDTVSVWPGTYFENLDFLGKNLTVRGSGAATTIIDGGGNESVVLFMSGETSGAVLEGFTIQNGRSSGTSVSLSRGGGIRCEGSSPFLIDLIIRDNRALNGAGAYFSGSNATISQCQIVDNNTGDILGGISEGGGVHVTCDSLPAFDGCTIARNSPASDGAGIYGGGVYRFCLIQSNRAYEGGGVHGGGCNPQLFDCIVRGNSTLAYAGDACSSGGGVYGPATLTRCIVSGNLGCRRAGGVLNATLVDCQVADNTCINSNGVNAGEGGGTYGCTLTGCEITGNKVRGYGPASARGAGVYGGTAVDCVIRDNVAGSDGVLAGGEGGGAYGALLWNCAVSENRCLGPAPPFVGLVRPASGGGIADCRASRCAIYDNEAMQAGGVLDGRLANCVVYGNNALELAGALIADVPVIVINSVLWGNSSPGATPEVFARDGTLDITYSNVEGSHAGTGNFSAVPDFWAPIAGDFALKTTSPCIDAGHPASPSDPDGSRADVGVFPYDGAYCGAAASYCEAKANSAGCLPAIQASGTPSLTGADDLVITVSSTLPGRLGVLFFSSGPATTPFAGGTLCLTTPVKRVGGQVAAGQDGCGGSYAFPLTQQRMARFGFGVEETIHAQIFYRDPLHLDGTGVGLTDAVAITFCP